MSWSKAIPLAGFNYWNSMCSAARNSVVLYAAGARLIARPGVMSEFI